MNRKSRKQALSQRERVLYLRARTTLSDGGCWEWTGTLQAVGYGKVSPWLDKNRSAHRAMFSLVVAPIPPKMYVLHTCDNRKCINPEHLWLGTHSDNQKDKVAKGRHNWKFSDEEISQLRRFASYGIQRKELVSVFKISTFWFDKIVKENRRTGDILRKPQCLLDVHKEPQNEQTSP
jgi:hypothetical protein